MAKLYIAEDVNLRRHYLTKIEMASDDSTGHASKLLPAPNSSSDAMNISVAKIFDFVKRHSEDFEADSSNPVAFSPKPASEVVNEDGTPKVMYLGTDSGDGEVGPNGEGGRYYLAPDEAKARQYGETVIEVYANAAEGIQADGTVIVQGAEHIKAVENQGTFDAGNPAIRYSLVEEGRMEAEGKDVFHERQGSARPRGVTIEEIGEAIRRRKQMGELVLEAQKLGYRSEAGRLAREIMNGSAEQSAVNIGLLAKAYARESGDEKYVGLAREREEKEGASEGRNLEELGARLQAAGKTSELIGEAAKQGQRRQSGRMAQGMLNGSVEQSAANLGLLAKVYAQESGDASLIQEAIATGERERRESPEGEAAGDEKEYEEFKELLEENAPQSLAEFRKVKYNEGERWERLKKQKEQMEFVNQAACETTKKKFKEYFLKPGAKHAQDFFDVGYAQSDWIQLRFDIAEQFDMNKAENLVKDKEGIVTFNIYMQLGVTKRRTFLTGWQIDETGKTRRIITGFRVRRRRNDM